jgi:hypothetical protein
VSVTAKLFERQGVCPCCYVVTSLKEDFYLGVCERGCALSSSLVSKGGAFPAKNRYGVTQCPNPLRRNGFQL